MIAENNASYVPKYVQIQNYILQKIEEGAYSAGDRIPSEAELSRQFDVSRITVNTAIKELSSSGIVERIQGKGTFVREVRQRGENQSMAFSGGIKIPSQQDLSNKPHRLVEHGIIQAGLVLCRKLGLEEGAYVYKILRSVSAKDHLDELDYSYIPLSVCSNHTFDQDGLEKMFLHDYICKYFTPSPSHLKIFIHAAWTEDMDISPFHKDRQDEQLFTWDTFVYGEQGILGLTTTVCVSQTNRLFMNLEL